MSQSVTLVRVVDQDEDAAAAAQLRDRDQRRYGPERACCAATTPAWKPDSATPSSRPGRVEEWFARGGSRSTLAVMVPISVCVTRGLPPSPGGASGCILVNSNSPLLRGSRAASRWTCGPSTANRTRMRMSEPLCIAAGRLRAILHGGKHPLCRTRRVPGHSPARFETRGVMHGEVR